MYKNLILKKNEKIYLQIYFYLKEKIEKEKIKGKLLPIRELAKQLNISPSTVVKAYDELEKNGLVTKKEGSGIYIKYEKYKNIYLEDHMEVENFKYGYFNPEFKIDFASATPNETILPMKSLKKAINFVLDRDKESAFLYEDPRGYFYLRKTIVDRLKKEENTDIKIENIQLVSGAQQGINMFAKSFLSVGDTVVVECPTYKGATDTFKKIGCKVLEISMNKDGYSIKELEKILKTKNIKLFYTMTNFQNPTGISTSLEKKIKLLQLANKNNFYILEDDGLSDLYFSKEKPSTLKSLDNSNRVIYIKSYSKIFMPGLRLAYIATPDRSNISISSKEASGIVLSGLNQRAFQYLLENHDWDKHMKKAREVFKEKQKLMYESLTSIKDISFFKPKGGLTFWVKLPIGVSSKAIYLKLLSNNIGILPGILFSDKLDDHIRISFAQCNNEDIKNGILCLENAINSLK